MSPRQKSPKALAPAVRPAPRQVPLPGGLAFCPPPGWPELPATFRPTRDFRPDPSWQPAPTGWQFYRDAFGYPTPAPDGWWRPHPATDWAARLGTDPDAMPPESDEWGPAEPVTPPRRASRWPLVVVLALVLALLGGAGWWAWPHLVHRLPASHEVSDIKGVYDPELEVGTTAYQLAGQVQPAKSFSGSSACVTKANAAVTGAAQAEAAGTEAGWGAMTWRFASTAAAQKAYQTLEGLLDGCTEDSYKLSNPQHSDDSSKTWVQYQQSATDGTDHGKVVLTTDANTLTWIEGGNSSLGHSAYDALRERLATLK